jgi:hypothetical protein
LVLRISKIYFDPTGVLLVTIIYFLLNIVDSPGAALQSSCCSGAKSGSSVIVAAAEMEVGQRP